MGCSLKELRYCYLKINVGLTTGGFVFHDICGSVVLVAGWRKADFVCVRVWSRTVVSSVSIVRGEFVLGNLVSLSSKFLMKISIIGFVRDSSVVEV